MAVEPRGIFVEPGDRLVDASRRPRHVQPLLSLILAKMGGQPGERKEKSVLWR
jgi:hypothetical protein